MNNIVNFCKDNDIDLSIRIRDAIIEVIVRGEDHTLETYHTDYDDCVRRVTEYLEEQYDTSISGF